MTPALSHATLTGVGGLTFLTGTADGFQDESLAGNNGAPDQLTMTYSSATTNDLNGFQAIVDACLVDKNGFELTLIGRAGAYHNQASGRVRESYTGIGTAVSSYERTFSDTKDTVAFVGGIGAVASMQLKEYLRVFAGYEGTFISGVALSPEQATEVRGGVYEVNTDGNVIVHGASLGVELIY